MQHDNLPFPDAVETLAAQAGLQVPKFSPEETKRAKEQKDLYSLMDEAAKWFEAQLIDGRNQDMLRYVHGRGLKDTTIAEFRLGYAPADAQALRKHLSQHGYKDQQMIDVGLVKPGKNGREPYVFFRDRIMVPVLDRRGRVVAFGGRILPDHLRPPDQGDFKPAKYMNSTETPIFNKSRVLYGAPQARQGAGDGHTLFVAEGYFDVIACHQAGFKGAVAPMGTALTEEQIMLLWKLIPSDEKVPVLCFDGDNAGRRAAERAMERVLPLLGAGRSVRFAFLPDGEDPDSLIASNGKAAFTKILENAIPMIEFLWRHHTAGRSFETPEERAALIKTLQDAVKKIADAEVQKHYDYLIRQKISDSFFNKAGHRKQGTFKKGSYQKQPVQPAGISLRSPKLQSKDIHVRIMIAAIINHPDIYADVEEQFAMVQMNNDRLDMLRQKLISVVESEEGIQADALEAALRGHGFGRELDHILSSATYLHGKFCSGAEKELEKVKEKWLGLWQDCEKIDLQKEIKAGWKSAFYASSEEDEERIKQMLSDTTL